MDLGANEVDDVPQGDACRCIAPAMLAAALLGFALSIDDFVITYFNAGARRRRSRSSSGAIARVSVPPQVNVVASAIFIVAIAIALGNVFWQYRSAKRATGSHMTAIESTRPAARRQGAPLDALHPHGRVRDGGRADHRPRRRLPPRGLERAGATSTRSRGSSRSTSATRSATRSARRRSSRCASCPSTRTGRTRTRARSSSRPRSRRSRRAT